MIDQLTKKQILDETIQYYKEDPSRIARKASNGGCMYFINDGRMCAVGRCMINPQESNRCGSVVVLWTIDQLNVLLKEQYRGHEMRFWIKLQYLHDNADWKDVESIKRFADQVPV